MDKWLLNISNGPIALAQSLVYATYTAARDPLKVTCNCGFAPQKVGCTFKHACKALKVQGSTIIMAAFIIAAAFQTAFLAYGAEQKPGQAKTPDNTKAALSAYLDRLRPKIAAHWILPDGKNHVEIKAIMHLDGSVSDVAVTSTPNNILAEQSANEAFAASQPFEALPSSVSHDASLTLIFDSSADPHGDSTSNISLRLDPVASAPNKPNSTNSGEMKE